MRSKPPLVLVIGPSGAGKSTLITSALTQRVGSGMRLQMLRKDSTRASRSTQDSIEYRHITETEFLARQHSGQYIIHYTIFAESYGIRTADSAIAEPSTILIQTVPTDVASRLRQLLRAVRPVAICLLDTPPEIARERLLRRADESTLRSLDDRMLTASRNRRSVADFVVAGGRAAGEELSDFLTWLEEIQSADASPAVRSID